MIEITGGFGTVIGFMHDWANPENTRRSWDMVARYVVPEVNGMLDAYRESQQYVIEHRDSFDRAGKAVLAKIMANDRARAALSEQSDGAAAMPSHHAPDLRGGHGRRRLIHAGGSSLQSCGSNAKKAAYAKKLALRSEARDDPRRPSSSNPARAADHGCVVCAWGRLQRGSFTRVFRMRPSYSAVRALLQKLLDKGHVRFRREGARYLYEPIVAAEDARASAWHRLLSTFFGDSPRDAFVHLLGREGDNLDATDLETLSTLVDELKARREGND